MKRRDGLLILQQVAWTLGTLALAALVALAVFAALANCADFQNTGPNVPPQENLTALDGSENQRSAGRFAPPPRKCDVSRIALGAYSLTWTEPNEAGVQDCGPPGHGYTN